MPAPADSAEQDEAAAPAATGWRRPALLFALAIVSVQALWILALPAFFGIDEFEHVYRAASVADGHWAPGTTAPDDGRGYLIRVPADLVAAAHEPCDALRYTKPDNCTATTAPDADATVLVASAAATYNPTWYAVVGTAAKPFSGDTALFVMRVVGALLCDAFLVGAAVLALRRRTSIWPFLGVALVAAPSLLYATTVAAPNGLGYSAAVLMWVAGLRLLRGEDAGPRASVAAFTLAAMVVMCTHTTGAMWVALSLVCTAPLWWGRGRALVRQDRTAFLVGTVLLGLTAAACAAWILGAHTNDPSDSVEHAGAMPVSLFFVGPVLWTLQAVATLRFRDVPAPLPVYGIAMALLAVLTVVAVRASERRRVLALALVAGATVAVPLVLTYVSYDAIASAWQGRYGLPLSVGFVLLAVEGLRDRIVPQPGVVWGLVGVLATMQALTVHGAFRESQTGYLRNPVALVVLGAAVYVVAIGCAARLASSAPAHD